MCDMLRIHNTAQLPRSGELISRGQSLGKITTIFQILLANFKFHSNFIFPGPFVFQISWQISLKYCSFNTLMMFFNFKSSPKSRKGQDR